MLTLDHLRASRFFMVFLGCMVALGPFAIDAYLPMIPTIAKHFHTDIIAVNLTMSTYLIGVAIGQFFGGALSDQLGRKRVGIIGLSLFCLTTYLIVNAESIFQVQLLRGLQAVGSGFVSVICLAQLRDLFPKEQVMSKYANVMLIVMLAPLFAPILGASLIEFGWQSLFILLGLWGLIILCIYVFYIPETLARKPDQFVIGEMFRGYTYVIRHRVKQRFVAQRFIIFAGFQGGVFFTFITNAALMYSEHFDQSAYRFAFIFAAHGVMLMVGNRLALLLTKNWSPLTVLKMANWTQLLITITLTLAVVTGMYSMLIILALTLLLMTFSGISMPTAPSIFIGYFNKNAGAATSIYTTTSFLVGALIGGTAAVLSKESLLPIFAIMAISCLCARIVLSTIQEPDS